MKIEVKIDGIKAVQARLRTTEKQIAYAAAVALTRTAKAVQAEMPAVMERQLDRPTPFTKGGLFVSPARRDRLVAIVGFKDRQASYLRWQIQGGSKAPGARGIKLPGNIQLNAFGNIPRGTIDKLKAAAESGQLSSAISRRLGVGNRRKGQAPLQLFVGKPAGRGWEKAPMGIWRRVPGSPGKLVPVILFEDRPVRYRPRFRFHEAAAAVVRREWRQKFDVALAEALRSAR